MPETTKPKDTKDSSRWGPKILEDAEFKENVDVPAFEQILEMDDDDDREFSTSIVYDFFSQASEKFKEMKTALEEKDLPALSALGHFLKGSSATLGLTKVKDHCEKIQHLGMRKNEEGTEDESDDEKSLEMIKKRVELAKEDFATAKSLLKRYYKDTSED